MDRGGRITWHGPGQLVGTSLKTDTDYLTARYEQPCFLLIGNEQQGLPADYEAECDLLTRDHVDPGVARREAGHAGSVGPM